MSEHAEQWAVRNATNLAMPDPCLRRQVLLALAARHVDGPFTIPTTTLAADLAIDLFQLWSALMMLRRCRLIEASNIGGLMNVTLAIDFPDENPVFVSACQGEAREVRK